MIDSLRKIAFLFVSEEGVPVLIDNDCSEDFQNLTFSCSFHLKRKPTKDVLLPLFPETSKRDNWALRIREEGGDDDIFDIKPGDDVGAKLDEFNVSIYKEEKVTLYYSICKQKKDCIISLYCLSSFCDYLENLTAFQVLHAIYNQLADPLILEIIGDDYEQFSTSSIAVIRRGDTVPAINNRNWLTSKYDQCRQSCQWKTIIPVIVPDDFNLKVRSSCGRLAGLFDKMCFLLSACYIADYSSIDKKEINVRISGFKALEYDKKGPVSLKDISFNNSSCEQWYKIYDWCYSGGHRDEKIRLARNIISLNCSNQVDLSLNASTLEAIKSNFMIYERDNVRQYINARNEVSKILLDLQKNVNAIVEDFIGDFRKSVLTIGSFFLSVVVIRVVSKGDFFGGFTGSIILLSFVFVIISAINLCCSRLSVDKKEKLFTKHYEQIKSRYAALFTGNELDSMFDDCNPLKLGAHSNYIKWQKDTYTIIWIMSLLLFLTFLIMILSYNVFETTNMARLIRTILLCCTKSI